MKVKLPSTKLAELKAALPWGAITIIATEANVSTQSVRDFFKGKYHNEAIFQAVLTCIERNKATKEQMSEQINNALAE